MFTALTGVLELGPFFYIEFMMEFLRKTAALIEKCERAVLVWTILGLALIGFIQVITRYLFNYSFSWYEELGRYLGVFIAFLGAAVGVRTSSHFAVDSLVNRMKPPFKQFTRSFTSLLSAAICFLIVYYSFSIIGRLYGYESTSPAMKIPMYIAYLPIPFFTVIMGFRFCIKAFTHYREGLSRKGAAAK